MTHSNRILVVDAGNTLLKTGLFVNHELNEVKRFHLKQLNELKEYVKDTKVSHIACSSVLSDQQNEELKNSLTVQILFFGTGDKLPIKNEYETPETLGFDRMCNAVGVFEKATTDFGLSIDIGTCVKFDLIHLKNGYMGGSISPGIDLRYKALNNYTANLPLLSDRTAKALVGTSTHSAITSGVINGMQAEIMKMIEWYQEAYSGLTIFVTGGDAQYFDFTSKNNIFADENLTLRGLYAVYKTTY